MWAFFRGNDADRSSCFATLLERIDWCRELQLCEVHLCYSLTHPAAFNVYTVEKILSRLAKHFLKESLLLSVTVSTIIASLIPAIGD